MSWRDSSDSISGVTGRVRTGEAAREKVKRNMAAPAVKGQCPPGWRGRRSYAGRVETLQGGKSKPTPGSLLSRYRYGPRVPETLALGRAVGPPRGAGGVGDAPGWAARVAEQVCHDGDGGVRGADAGAARLVWA